LVIASERVQFRLLTGFVHAARLKEGRKLHKMVRSERNARNTI
jgi:hypothetical protein